MSNTRITKKKEELKFVGDTNKKTVIKENEYKLQGMAGKEVVYYENFNMYELANSTADEPIYKSEISIGGKIFDLFIKYNQGRKTTTPIHIIITNDGQRNSLGFYMDINLAFRKTREFIYNNITKLAPPKNI